METAYFRPPYCAALCKDVNVFCFILVDLSLVGIHATLNYVVFAACFQFIQPVHNMVAAELQNDSNMWNIYSLTYNPTLL